MSSPVKCNHCGNFMDGSTCISRMTIGRNQYNRIPYGTELVIRGDRKQSDPNGSCPNCNVFFNGFYHFLVKKKFVHVVAINPIHAVVG